MWRTGNLYLTTRRLIWLSYRWRLPWVKPDRIVLSLDGIEQVKMNSYLWIFPELEVDTKSAQYTFSLYRWIAPAIGWLGLTRRWVQRINEARNAASAK